MKQHKKKTIRIILIAIFFFLVLMIAIPISIVLFDAYCQDNGVPGFIRNRILTSLKEQGIRAEIEEIKAGLLTGASLENVIVKDYEESHWKLLTAKKVVIEFDIYDLFRGTIKIKTFKIVEGTLRLPLSLDSENHSPVLKITDIMCKIDHQEEKFEVAAFSGIMDSIQLNMKGDVFKPLPDDSRKINRLTIKPLLQQISPAVIDYLNHVQKLSQFMGGDTTAKANVNAIIPNSHPSESTVDIRVLLTKILYSGIDVKSMAFGIEFKNKTITLSDFRFEFDDNEYLRGNLKIPIGNDEISGQLAFHGYPYKILKIVAPKILENTSIPLPEFGEDPMSATIRIHPSPLSNMSQWHCEINIMASKMKFAELSVSTLNGNFEIKNHRIDFSDVHTRILPNSDLYFSGSYLRDEKELLVKAEVIGNPLFVANFSRNKKFKKTYKKIWQEFEWKSADPPHFMVDAYYSARQPDRRLVINMKSKMSDYLYKGVKVDQVTGNVFLEFPGPLVLIDNLKVVINGQKAIGDLVWYGKPAKLDFDLSSQIKPPDLLGLFNRKWHNFLEKKGLVFTENPTVSACGYFTRGDELDHQVSVMLHGKNLNYKGALLNNFQGSIDIRKDLTTIITKIEGLLYNEWTLKKTEAELLIRKGASKISGKVDHTEGLGIYFEDTDFIAKNDGEKTYVDSDTMRVTFGEWRLNDVKAKSVYDRLNLKSTSTINNADFRQMEFGMVTTDFRFADKKLTANLTIDGAAVDNKVTFTGINGDLTVTDNMAEMKGTISELTHHPTNGSSRNVKMDCDYSDNIFNMRISTDHFYCLDQCELNQLKLNLSFDNGVPYGDYKIQDFVCQNSVTGRDLKGTFDEFNGPLSFHSRWGEVVFPLCKLTKVTSAGKLTGNQIKSSVSAELCEVNQHPFENVTGAFAWNNKNLSINRVTGNVYGGKVAADFFYNKVRDEGKIWLTAVDVGFGELVPNKGHNMTGKLSGKVDLKLQEALSDLKLHGQGKVFVDKGNFWKVPYLSDFLQSLSNMKIIGLVVPQGELGEITELSTDIEFENNKVYFPNMKTNGNIVLITGEGNYWWSTKELDFRVKAKPLNPFFSKFLPEAIDPFAILLERRLTGKLDDPKWEEVSAIRDFFRPKEEETKEPPL